MSILVCLILRFGLDGPCVPQGGFSNEKQNTGWWFQPFQPL